MSRLGLAFTAFGLVGLLAACDSDTVTGDEQNITDKSCSATLRVLQKDAYKSTAGRTSDLWPPHTTTVLEYSCEGDGSDSVVMANHGTLPGATDANGDVILVETRAIEVKGSEEDILDLAVAFEACECDGATTFLSLDTLEDSVAQDLLGEVVGYLQANLVCDGDGVDQIVGALQSQDVDTALAVLPTCSWANGTSLEEGLDEAFAALLEATGDTLDGYHVCNNDASLQVGLVEGYEASGEVGACDATGAACKGPLWFYSP